MIYLDISPQKNPSYGGSKNCILVQDSDTRQRWCFFTKAKEYLTEKVTPFLNKRKTMKKSVNFFSGTMQAKTRLSKKIAQSIPKKLTFSIYATRHSTEKLLNLTGIFYTSFLNEPNDGAHGTE